MILKDIILKVMNQSPSVVLSTETIKNMVNQYCHDNKIFKRYQSSHIKYQLDKMSKKHIVYRHSSSTLNRINWKLWIHTNDEDRKTHYGLRVGDIVEYNPWRSIKRRAEVTYLCSDKNQVYIQDETKNQDKPYIADNLEIITRVEDRLISV